MTDPILLPSRPGVKTDKVRMVDYGGQLKPTLGGPVQNLSRLGTRHAIDITLPVIPAEPTGRIWASRLRQAKLYGAIMPFTQDGFRVGLPGTPLVNGGGQSGIQLALKNFRPRYAVREGQAFSLVHAGVRYLHFAAMPGIADASGNLALTIFPMLRFLTTDGDAAEFGKPMFQGSISGNEASWDRLTAPFCDFGTISISEDY
jgi:hypothetical protein